MVRTKRIGSYPLESLALVNAQVDVRRAHREQTAEELRKVLVTASSRPRSRKPSVFTSQGSRPGHASGRDVGTGQARCRDAPDQLGSGRIAYVGRGARRSRVRRLPQPPPHVPDIGQSVQDRPADAQELAGHSKPELTARYSHRRLYDLAGAVEKLPSMVLGDQDDGTEPQVLRATGTDGPTTSGDDGERFGCSWVAGAGVSGGLRLALVDTEGRD